MGNCNWVLEREHALLGLGGLGVYAGMWRENRFSMSCLLDFHFPLLPWYLAQNWSYEGGGLSDVLASVMTAFQARLG